MEDELQTSMTNSNGDFDFEKEFDKAEEAQKQPEKTPARLRVKYNGEEKDLSDEDAVAYAQKGMNYDKVKGQLDSLKAGGADEALEVEKMIADSYDMSVKEYREFARKNISEQAKKAELDKIYKESPDIKKELAEELAETRLAAKHKARAEKEEAAEAEPWEKLAEEYPDIKTADDVPEDVREAVLAGKDPLLAMREHEIAELKGKLKTADSDAKAKEANTNNKNKAIGSVAGEDGSQRDDIASILWPGA